MWMHASGGEKKSSMFLRTRTFVMAVEQHPLLPGSPIPRSLPGPRRRCIISLAICTTLLVAQGAFQTFLPEIAKMASTKTTLCLAILVPCILGALINIAWVPITNTLETFVHRELFNTELNKKQRDSLRKFPSLDTLIQISVLKIPVIFYSLYQASSQATGATIAVMGSSGLILCNYLMRRLMGEFDLMEKIWEERLQRDKLL